MMHKKKGPLAMVKKIPPDIENNADNDPSLLPTSQNIPPNNNPTTNKAKTRALKKLGCLM